MSDPEQSLRTALRAVADQVPAAPSGTMSGRRRTPVAAAAVVVVCIALGATLAAAVASRTGRTVVSTATATSGPLPAGPLEGRVEAESTWTGRQWLVWGGQDLANRVLGDGASYDPATATWHRLPAAPIAGRTVAGSVWTGEQWLIWGGTDGSRTLLDGAGYDPRGGSWKRLPPAPAALDDADHGAVEAVWTGREMLVLADDRAAAYDPATSTWAMLPDAPGQASDPPEAVWTGTAGVFLVGGARPSPTTPAGPGCSGAQRCATLLPAIGAPSAVASPGGLLPAGPSEPAPVDHGAYTLVSLNPTTRRWTSLPTDASLASGIDPALGWDGRHLYVFDLWAAGAGAAGPTPAGFAASLDPVRGIWSALPAAPGVGTYRQSAAVYDGRMFLLWDGGPTGLSYDPVGRSWTGFDVGPTAELEAPVTVWTGTAVLVWGAPSNASGDAGAMAAGGEYLPGQ